MRITAAMLADAAQVNNGRLYVIGGAVHTIRTRQVPAVHRSLTVVVVAEVGPDERHADLSIRVEMLDEDMNPTGIEAQGTIRVGAPPTLVPGQTSTVPLAIPFYGLRFEEAKGYVFRVTQDDEELVRIPFWVVVAPTTVG